MVVGEVGGLGGEGAGEDVEVVDQALQVGLVAGEGAEGPPGAGDQAREVVLLGSEEGIGDLGAVATGVAAVFEGAVERLRRRSCPCTSGSWVASSAAVGLCVSAVP